MIELETIDIQGFGSIVDRVVYKLNYSGINLLRGHNGAGKSTLIAAIVWVIYGKLLGKTQVTPWSDILPPNFTGTSVKLTFKRGGRRYKIIRCHGFTQKVMGSKGNNRLMLIENGELVENLRNKTDVQREILKLFPVSYQLFQNTIVLGQNITRILDERGDKQKALLDEAFSTMYIQKARDKAKKDLQAVWTEVAEVKSSIELLRSKLKYSIEAHNTLHQAKASFKAHKKTQIEDIILEKRALKTRQTDLKAKRELHMTYQGKEQTLRKKLTKIESTKNTYSELSNNKFKRELEIATQTGAIKDLENEVTALSKTLVIGVRCKLCGNKLKSISKANIKDNVRGVKKKIAVEKKALLKLKSSLVGIETEMGKLRGPLSSVKALEGKLQKIVSKKDANGYYPGADDEIKDRLDSLKVKYQKVRATKWGDNAKLKNLREEIRIIKINLKPKRSTLQELTKKHDLLQWLVNDPLSNKGLKAFIFNQLLHQISDRTKFYEAYSGIRLSFGIDLQSANKSLKVEVIKGSKSRPYEALSGGEKQLANITASLAIHDVISMDTPFNVVFMDEIFESLDKANIQMVSDLISLRAKSQIIHLITHRNEFNIYNPRIVELSRGSDGITRMAA